MSRPVLWLLSLLAFAALCAACVALHARSVERDVTTRTLDTLSGSDLRGAAQVTFSGRDATVRADDPTIAQLVAERVEGVRGVRSATVAGPLAPLPAIALDGPFALTPLASGGLALRGAVPDRATRDRLLAAAQMAFPDRRIRDGLALDSTAPGDWAADAAATFSRLKAVQDPGLAVDASGALVLSGAVDGEGTRANVGSRVAEVVAPRAVTNLLAIRGAPREAASGETSGAAPEAGSPEAPAPEATPQAPSAAPDASGAESAGQVEVQNALAGDAEAQALERALTRSLGRGAVTFEAGTDRLTPGSADVLRRAADALKANPEIAIELQAHTDSEGPTRSNQRLSEARARAAKRVLTASGVLPDQLLAAGYGESTPIAPNSTEAGRAQNRRVVFKLLRRR